MHELSVTKSILDLCVQEAKKNGLKKVSKVVVKLGKFTGFSAEAISFYFTSLEAGTACAGARLVFEDIPIRIKCPKCGFEGMIEEPVFVCPECQGKRLDITGGREFYIESIEGS
jgi:hydrogenase nickel incorporation protein HypA/HybF